MRFFNVTPRIVVGENRSVPDMGLSRLGFSLASLFRHQAVLGGNDIRAMRRGKAAALHGGCDFRNTSPP